MTILLPYHKRVQNQQMSLRDITGFKKEGTEITYDQVDLAL